MGRKRKPVPGHSFGMPPLLGFRRLAAVILVAFATVEVDRPADRLRPEPAPEDPATRGRSGRRREDSPWSQPEPPSEPRQPGPVYQRPPAGRRRTRDDTAPEPVGSWGFRG